MAGIQPRVAPCVVYLLFEFGDLLLALGPGTRRIRDPIDIGH